MGADVVNAIPGTDTVLRTGSCDITNAKKPIDLDLLKIKGDHNRQKAIIILPLFVPT